MKKNSFGNLENTKIKKKTTGVGSEIEIDITRVYPNPNQPRKTFDEKKLLELTISIKEDGLWDAIVVIESDDGYMIISGEYRYKAHHINEMKTIRCHIIKLDEKGVWEVSFKSNDLRDDMLPIEKANYIIKMWESGFYKEKRDLAASLKKSPSYISKCLSVLNLGDDIIDKIFDGSRSVSIEVLSELASIKDKEFQRKLFDSGVSRDEIREAKKGFKKPVVYKPKNFEFTESVEWADIEDAIKQCGDKCRVIVEEIV
jgi:ParB family chromosome partitioning protein